MLGLRQRHGVFAMKDPEAVVIELTADEISQVDVFAARISTPSHRVTRAEAVQALMNFALIVAGRVEETEVWLKKEHLS